jgi:predicted AAA+ superfamily ATPase
LTSYAGGPAVGDSNYLNSSSGKRIGTDSRHTAAIRAEIVEIFQTRLRLHPPNERRRAAAEISRREISPLTTRRREGKRCVPKKEVTHSRPVAGNPLN